MPRSILRLPILAKAIFLAALQFAFAHSTHAMEIWSYTGDPFDLRASTPLSSADFISGSITLVNPAPLNGGITLNSTTVSDFSFGIGQGFVLDDANAAFGSASIGFTNGVATVWLIQVISNTSPPGPAGDPHNYGLRSSSPGAVLSSATLFFATGLFEYGQSSGPGSWALVPEPSNFSLSALGLLTLAAVRTRRQ